MNDSGRTVLIIVVALVALPLLWGVLMMGGMGPGMMGTWYAGGGWQPWRFVVGMIAMVIVVGGITALVVWTFGRTGTSSSSDAGQRSVRDLLDARYARGEITREQYQQMREDLSS